MNRVRGSYWQEVFSVYKDTSFLLDSERTLCSRGLNVPEEVLLVALKKVNEFTVTYIFNGFHGFRTFLFVEFAILVFVKHF